jgi:hypothetical protein
MKRVIAALAILIPSYVNAVPITWTLENVAVGLYSSPPLGSPYQVGTLTGSFTYDADLDLYSDINISTTSTNSLACAANFTTGCLITVPGTPFDAQQYDAAVEESLYTAPTGLVAVNSSRVNGVLDGDTLLSLAFSQALTNAGGIISLSMGVEYYCLELTCPRTNANLFRYVIGPGGVLGAPGYDPRIVGVASVPEPGTLMLFLTGGLLLAGARRKRSALAQ